MGMPSIESVDSMLRRRPREATARGFFNGEAEALRETGEVGGAIRLRGVLLTESRSKRANSERSRPSM